MPRRTEASAHAAPAPPGVCARDMVMLTDIESLQRDLVRDLHQVIDMLHRQGESRWAEWLADDRDLIRQGDVFGLDHLLSGFAGLGSINDLWLTRTTSFSPVKSLSLSGSSDRGAAANESFQTLLRRVWEQASLLRRVLRTRDYIGGVQ